MELFSHSAGFLGDAKSQADHYSKMMYLIMERCIIHLEQLRQKQREQETEERAARIHSAVVDFQQASASYNESVQKLSRIEESV